MLQTPTPAKPVVSAMRKLMIMEVEDDEIIEYAANPGLCDEDGYKHLMACPKDYGAYCQEGAQLHEWSMTEIRKT